jgi:hypothetical protein
MYYGYSQEAFALEIIPALQRGPALAASVRLDFAQLTLKPDVFTTFAHFSISARK